jgi:uncharacterized glyoxalase superfamily protein PhnB
MNQTIIPMLSYEDGVKALDWLCRAFGFDKKEEWIGEDGRLAHGEIQLSGQRIMLATPSPFYICPAKLRKMSPDAAAMYETSFIVDGILVYVKNVTTHFAIARENGAVILSEIEDGPPGKRYRAEDPEGHRWMFMEMTD